jgi:hypothetical protein
MREFFVGLGTLTHAGDLKCDPEILSPFFLADISSSRPQIGTGVISTPAAPHAAAAVGHAVPDTNAPPAAAVRHSTAPDTGRGAAFHTASCPRSSPPDCGTLPSTAFLVAGFLAKNPRNGEPGEIDKARRFFYYWAISAATSSPNFFWISFWVSGSKSVMSNIRRTSTISLSFPGMREAHSSASSRDFTWMIQ